jgi:glycosyltransferase involved in cell wall biosynthesis
MNDILVLTFRYPFPVLAGDSLRIYNICKELSKEYSLTLLSFCESADIAEPDRDIFSNVYRVRLPTWRSLSQVLWALLFQPDRPLQVAYYHSARFQDKVDALLDQHRLCLAHDPRTGQYVRGKSSVKKVLELTDANAMNYERVGKKGRTSGLKQWVYRIERPRIQQYETQMVDDFDLVSLVSPVDKRYVEEQIGSEREHLRVFSNGVDVSDFPFQGPADDPCIGFIGNMRAAHNVDACEYFADEILPIVAEEVPEVEFKIIGDGPQRTVNRLNAKPRVSATGRVPSVAEAARDVLCGVATLRIGAGLQNKVLEYMALGLPAVVNTVGYEGVEADPGTEILVADSPDDIAGHVVDLIRNEDHRARMAQAGRQYVETHHRWESVMRPYVEAVHNLMAQSANAASV